MGVGACGWFNSMADTKLWSDRDFEICPQLGLANKYPVAPLELDLSGLIKLLGLPSSEGGEAESRITQIMSELREVQNSLEYGPGPFKPVSEDSSIARLVILDLVITKIQPDLIIETGTQHGVSATVISKNVTRAGKNILIKSIDVAHQLLIRREANVDYVVLDSPIRKNFKKATVSARNINTVFFHDSDHSYENMYFEFGWAWNRLGVSALISDDAAGNSAFLDFCSRNNLPGHLISIDNGPVVGLILRDEIC